MTVPDFLIVGAMKAGTTTLHRDLGMHPDIFLPAQKEPETLVRFDDLVQCERDYGELFALSAAGMIRGEASTAYTKRPVHEGVAEKARDLTGGLLRIVYIRRDPVARIVSHYRHSNQQGRMPEPLSEALRTYPDLIAFSRYDWQIEPWKRMFGPDRVLEIELETYSANRMETVRRVVSHIGADPERLPLLDDKLVANSAKEMKHIENGLLNSLVRSKFYQRRVKPVVPSRLREASRRAILPPPPDVDVTLSAADLEFIAQQLAADEIEAH
ncbi:MAG: sulfotransferase [Novosphingobium sp.]|nr:sulfotransferase [Novosphingobium sp.]